MNLSERWAPVDEIVERVQARYVNGDSTYDDIPVLLGVIRTLRADLDYQDARRLHQEKG